MLPHPLRKPSYVILFLALVLSLLGAAQASRQELSVAFLDVGQGDAILIKTPEHRNILVDAGPDGSLIGALDKEMGFFSRKIDLFVLSHPHRDHFMGLLDAAKTYPIEKIMLTGVASQDALYLELLRELKAQGTEFVFPQSGQDWQIGKGLFLDILYPFRGESLWGQDVKNKNNSSVALMLRGAKGEPLALLTGDAEEEQEKEILLSGQALQSPVLKLGHHGSRTSSSQDFLDAVRPSVAVVSAGQDNSFKHPHPETLEKTKSMRLHRTDLEGSVVFAAREIVPGKDLVLEWRSPNNRFPWK